MKGEVKVRNDGKGKDQSFEAEFEFDSSSPTPGWGHIVAWGRDELEARQNLKKGLDELIEFCAGVRASMEAKL